MSIITATNYNGRLHVGYGDEYSASKRLGSSINSYRNPISKFFTKLFGFSMDIQVDGKQRCLNKKSFKKHLQSIGFDIMNVEEVGKIGYETFIQKNSDKLIVSNKKLGESFSIKKRMKLFNKMIKELDANNTQAVIRLICKGAYIDKLFYRPTEGSLLTQSFWNSRSMLELRLSISYFSINFYSYTPLALAVEKGNQSLAKFILNIKNNDHSSDKKQTIRLALTRETDSNVSYRGTAVVQTEQVAIENGNIHLITIPS